METMPLSEVIWKSKYRYTQARNAPEKDIGDTWRRIAGAVVAIENDSDVWQQTFEED